MAKLRLSGPTAEHDEGSQETNLITRPDVHVDACERLADQRFIDPKARFVFGDAREGAVSFDMFEGDYTHEAIVARSKRLLSALGRHDGALRPSPSPPRHRRDGARRGNEKTGSFRRGRDAGIRAVDRGDRQAPRARRGAHRSAALSCSTTLRISAAVPTSANERKAEPLESHRTDAAVVERGRRPTARQSLVGSGDSS